MEGATVGAGDTASEACEGAHSGSVVRRASLRRARVVHSGGVQLMQEYIGNLCADFWEAFGQVQQADWARPACLIIGGVICSRLCASGRLFTRLMGLGGLAIVAWELRRCVMRLFQARDQLLRHPNTAAFRSVFLSIAIQLSAIRQNTYPKVLREIYSS